MRLLILTQVVDSKDPILGFFHRWIQEFAIHCKQVEVICLQEGTHSLPQHVRVHTLGKERGSVGKVTYAFRFYKQLWQLRGTYDAVLVHMNPEYITLGGLWWRLSGKRIGLWYVHKSVTLYLRIATLFTHAVFTASPESFRLTSSKVRVVGHGIDTDFFTPNPTVPRENTLLSVGRLSAIKRNDLIIKAAHIAQRPLDIIGDGPERERLETLAATLKATRVRFLGPLTQSAVLEAYQRAGVFVHASETGSLDKVVLEALACGLPVVTTSRSLQGPVVVADPTPEAITAALALTKPISATYVRETHSLPSLVRHIMAVYEK